VAVKIHRLTIAVQALKVVESMAKLSFTTKPTKGISEVSFINKSPSILAEKVEEVLSRNDYALIRGFKNEPVHLSPSSLSDAFSIQSGGFLRVSSEHRSSIQGDLLLK